MKYVFAFNEINYGRIEIEADHKPDNGEIINEILAGKAVYNETDFTDFKLIEADGKLRNDRDRGGTDLPGSFKVTITETLKLTVDVEAQDHQEAEQLVSDNWRAGDYILDADNFVGVEFESGEINAINQ